ncbi:hypothetical protein Aduo_019701 [Ancylostoma duodenale]
MGRPKKGRRALTAASKIVPLETIPEVPPTPPAIVEDDRPRPRRLVDAISVYIDADALLTLRHREMNELRACVNYVMAGLYLQFAERSPEENVCPDLMRKLLELFGDRFLVVPDYLFLGVPASATAAEENRRVRERVWPFHTTTFTSVANEVLRCCGEAFHCLRERTNDDTVPCPFFPHGTDDVVAKSSVKDGDNAAMRKVLRDSITIRAGHGYTVHIQQCLRKADYEKGYKYSVLAIQAIG